MIVKICRECKKEYEAIGRGTGRFCSLKCRFFSKVEKTDTCWNWTGSHNRNKWGKRYGTIQMGEKNMLAHRVSYEIFKKAIPKGKIICHQCDNESCVNPDHLWIGTYSDNMQDMIQKGRGNFLSKENNVSSKLSNSDVEKIRELKIEGMMVKDIASLFKVSRQTIGNILHGRNWRN